LAKPEVTAIMELFGVHAENGGFAPLIEHLAGDGQLVDNSILTHRDFHLS
jgi:hypothetical protein